MSNVPSVQWTDAGFVAPTTEQVLAGVQADYSAAFGVQLNYQLTTPQGQLTSSETAIIVNANDLFLYYVNQVDPATSSGRMQDAIGALYDVTRFPAQPTVLQLSCLGLAGVTIPVGATVVDGADNIYVCTQAGPIGVGGSVQLPFAAQTVGPIAVPDAVSIYQAIPGWDSATIVSGEEGQATESRAQFEARRQQSVAKNSIGQLQSILGAVLAVSGVLDAYVTENDEPTPQTIGGFVLVPNSLYVAVVGGDNAAIAQAIWSKKSPGCAYNGNVTVTVTDTTGYSAPYPTYTVKFENPAPLPTFFAVVITGGPNVPADAASQIRSAILAAFNGEDGGQRARIGATIFSSRYVTAVVKLGDWVQLQSLLIGSTNSPVANYTASVAGNVMTVTAITTGALAVDQNVADVVGGLVPAGTTIQSQSSGPAGGIGTYVLSNGSLTIASTTMDSVVPSGTTIAVDIDQVPQLSSANISVSIV